MATIIWSTVLLYGAIYTYADMKERINNAV